MLPVPLRGRCTCGHVDYRIEREPLFVHCCHCRWCQRETGSAFVLNAMVERAFVTADGEPEIVSTPSQSGRGQKVARCPMCRVAVWSHYSGAGDAICFVRAGTLLEPDQLPPDVHIYTESKQPWVQLQADVPAFEQFYSYEDLWPEASLARRRALDDGALPPDPAAAARVEDDSGS